MWKRNRIIFPYNFVERSKSTDVKIGSSISKLSITTTDFDRRIKIIIIGDHLPNSSPRGPLRLVVGRHYARCAYVQHFAWQSTARQAVLRVVYILYYHPVADRPIYVCTVYIEVKLNKSVIVGVNAKSNIKILLRFLD